jgi:uracil-DNA glycosylase family 4
MNNDTDRSPRSAAIDYLRMLERSGFIALPEGALSPVEEAPNPCQSIGKAGHLAQIALEIAQCQKCALCQTRTNTVPGVGDPDAKLVFVGEAPGFYEDQKGEPFVGKAGDLLDKMIGAMGFSRQTVHILNVIKCRPPDNRNPNPDEIASCEDYLLRQLEVIEPKLIVSLGNFASHCLLATNEPISRLRGNWKEYHGIKLMPTFHPAYLLRNPGGKRQCWDDLQKVIAEYERLVGPLPGKPASK